MTNTQKFAKQELDILAATVPDAIVTPFAKEINISFILGWRVGYIKYIYTFIST